MTLPEILDGLAAAVGPDRDIDRAIGLLVGDLHIVDDPRMSTHGRLYRRNEDGDMSFGGLSDDILIRQYTGPTDAALALAERAIPGVWWMLGKGKTRPDEPIYGAQMLFGAQPIGEGEHEYSLAIAVCIAVLKARAWA